MKKINFILCLPIFIFMICSCKDNNSSFSQSYSFDRLENLYIDANYCNLKINETNEYSDIFVELEAKNINTIDNDDNSLSINATSVDLCIYIGNENIFNNLIIEADENEFRINNLICKNFVSLSKILFLSIAYSTIDTLSVNSSTSYYSRIYSCKIENTNIFSEYTHTFLFNKNDITDFTLVINKGNLNFEMNHFNKGSIKMNGNLYCKIYANSGYLFEIYSKKLQIDFETINYNDFYFYNNPTQYLLVENPYYETNITRYY